MTYTQVAEMIAEVGIPYRYHHFPNNTGQQPPFICFSYPGDHDFIADDSNYRKINQLTIELYTDYKDFNLEAEVERVLTAHELVYTRDEAFISEERMYMVTFNTEVLIDYAE